MIPREPRRRDGPKSLIANAGLAMMIPGLMVAGPLVGYGVGWFIRRMTGWGDWIEILMTVMGLVAGIREVIRVIRKIS